MELHSQAVAMSKNVNNLCFLTALVFVSVFPVSYSIAYAPNPSLVYEASLSPEYYHLAPDHAPAPPLETGIDQLPAPEYPAPPLETGTDQLPATEFPTPPLEPGTDQLAAPEYSAPPLLGTDQFPAPEYPSPPLEPKTDQLPAAEYPAPPLEPESDQLPAPEYPALAPKPGTDQLLATEYASPSPPSFIEQQYYAPISTPPSGSPLLRTSDQDGAESTDQSTVAGSDYENVSVPSRPVIVPSNYSAEDEVDAFVQEQQAYPSEKNQSGAVLGILICVGLVGFAGFVCFNKKNDKRRTQEYESLSKKSEDRV